MTIIHLIRCKRVAWALLLATGCLLAPGCSNPFLESEHELEVSHTDDPDSEIRYIGDIALATGLKPQKIESIALMTSLRGTGSDPSPNSRRTMLINDMLARGIKHPDDILALESTSLVIVQGFLPPAIKKGERFDLIVQTARRSDTTSLHGGWVMSNRLRKMQVLEQQVRTGHVVGIGKGPVLVESIFSTEGDPVLKTRGRVLGGGVSMLDRTLGLVVSSDHFADQTTVKISAAVNRRFFAYDHGVKRGVATPKDNHYIDLLLPDKYKQNILRFFSVVRAIAIKESFSDQARRLDSLQKQLLEPRTAAKTALRLEGIGKEAISVLKTGLSSNDVEVRFYSAEALAYLDEPEAIAALADAAKNEPAFRWHALTALCVLDDIAAYDALAELLHVPSAATRYGALRALRARNPKDPLVRGEVFEDKFRLHVIDSMAEPMIHFTRSRVAEVAIFGRNVSLKTPLSISAGKDIVIKDIGPERLRLSRFSPGQDDRVLECSVQLADLVRTIAELEGGYPDLVQAIEEAKAQGALDTRVIIDATAKRGVIKRSPGDHAEGESEQTRIHVATRTPNLFYSYGDRVETTEHSPPDWEEEDESESGWSRFWSKMAFWSE